MITPLSALLRAFSCALGLSLGLAALPAIAQSQEAPAYPRVTVGGHIFADYTVPFGGPQAFHVTRAFVTTTGRLNEVWSGLIQLNPAALAYTNANGAKATDPQNVILQMAYIQADQLLPGVTMQAGQLFVPWSEYAYTYFPYRMIATLPIEGGLGTTLGLGGPVYIGSWDRGIKLKGKLGSLAVNAAVINGEGLRGVEGDGQRSYQAVLSYALLPELDLAVLGHRGNPSNGLQADRWGGMAVYHVPGLNLGAEATGIVDVAATGAATSRQLYSGFGVYDMPVPWSMPTKLIARGTLTNAQGAGAGSQLESLVGLGVTPVNGFQIVLDHQVVQNLSGALTPEAHVLALHTSFAY